MARKRKYNPKGFAHIYQRGYRMSVLFYSVKDILVFYTILHILKKKYDITIVELVCMYNHYHMLLKSDNQETVSRFMCEFETIYAKEFNKDIGAEGHVFQPNYGLSNKIGDKKKRDSCAYLANNPVEKGLAVKAEDYRWNFLAYAVSDHPFSKKLVVRNASTKMKKVLAEVKYLQSNVRYVNYTFLRKWFSVLKNDEINQLIDYIIVKYKVLDYDEAIHLYGSFDSMLIAVNSNTGSEHDIKEDYSDRSYMPYVSLIRSLSREYGFVNPKEVLRLSPEDRRRLCEVLIREKHVTRFIAETLLHIHTYQK